LLALGAAIFAAGGAAARDEIVVTREQIQSLALGFARTWQRPPTPEERDGLSSPRCATPCAATSRASGARGPATRTSGAAARLPGHDRRRRGRAVRRRLALLLAMATAGAARAHEVRPVYLELHERDATTLGSP
jgi:hypothetical protein